MDHNSDDDPIFVSGLDNPPTHPLHQQVLEVMGLCQERLDRFAQQPQPEKKPVVELTKQRLEKSYLDFITELKAHLEEMKMIDNLFSVMWSSYDEKQRQYFSELVPDAIRDAKYTLDLASKMEVLIDGYS